MATHRAIQPATGGKRHGIDCRHKNNAPSAPVTVPDSQTLYIHLNDEAEWASSEMGRFVVRFNGPKGSPFSEATYPVPKGGSITSGPITGRLGKYKYEIEDEQGNKQDPEIVIEK